MDLSAKLSGLDLTKKLTSTELENHNVIKEDESIS